MTYLVTTFNSKHHGSALLSDVWQPGWEGSLGETGYMHRSG